MSEMVRQAYCIVVTVANALLPDSGSGLEHWRAGEQARPIRYLVDAFASDVRLPKLLNRQAILATLLDGCQQGIFVFRTRPSGASDPPRLPRRMRV